MALSTPRECCCRRPHGDPGSICWTCKRRVGGSSGSDDHSYQFERTYTESFGPAFGYAFEEGRDATALALPGGYYKRTTSSGRDWFETVAWGGSSNSSYAYAGQDGMVASAGPGGHAVSVSGSGSRFEAKIMGPRGQIIHRLPDGSIRRSKVTNTDENYRATKYGDEIHRTFEYDDEEVVPIKYKDEDRKGIKHSKKEQKAIQHGNKPRRVIMWNM